MSSELRQTCLKCVLKHLGQAIVLLSEAQKGYPEHKYIALGHLAEAEDESIQRYPKTTERIRSTRLSLEEGQQPRYSIEELIKEVDGLQEDDDGCGFC